MDPGEPGPPPGASAEWAGEGSGGRGHARPRALGGRGPRLGEEVVAVDLDWSWSVLILVDLLSGVVVEPPFLLCGGLGSTMVGGPCPSTHCGLLSTVVAGHCPFTHSGSSVVVLVVVVVVVVKTGTVTVTSGVFGGHCPFTQPTCVVVAGLCPFTHPRLGGGVVGGLYPFTHPTPIPGGGMVGGLCPFTHPTPVVVGGHCPFTHLGGPVMVVDPSPSQLSGGGETLSECPGPGPSPPCGVGPHGPTGPSSWGSHTYNPPHTHTRTYGWSSS